MDHHELTPPYVRYLIRLIRPFPNFDFFFIKPLRQRAVLALQLIQGTRVLDVGCGPGGCFPYLVQAVGSSGEVVGVEISPEATISARRRIATNQWSNVQVVEADARTVQLEGSFGGLVLFGAPDVYASHPALTNLFQYLKADARVVAFGAKLSRRRVGSVLNWLFRSLMKLSFASTPALNYEPWCLLEHHLTDVQVQEYLFGCMFLAWGVNRTSTEGCGESPRHL